MNPQPRLTGVLSAIRAIAAVLSVLLASQGCKNDQSSPQPPTDTTHASPHYGSGALSFDASPKGGAFSVSGSYKPSDQFLNDSLSGGTGGFVHDTTLVELGRVIDVFLTSYTHRLHVDTIHEQWIQIALRGSGDSVTAGDYPFAPSNTAQPGRTAYILYFYTNSDSGAFREIYVPKTGVLHLTSYQAGARRMQGTFSGTLWGPLPDTSTQVTVSSGSFDITLVSSYFNP